MFQVTKIIYLILQKKKKKKNSHEKQIKEQKLFTTAKAHAN